MMVSLKRDAPWWKIFVWMHKCDCRSESCQLYELHMNLYHWKSPIQAGIYSKTARIIWSATFVTAAANWAEWNIEQGDARLW